MITPSDETIALYLERNGFLRKVAGNEVFEEAIKCFNLMLSTGKGVFITGRCGVGKTLFCNIASKAVQHERLQTVRLGLPNQLALITDDYYFQRSMSGSVILDDIGAERAVNEYGVIRESVGEFITAFHTRWAGDTATSVRLFGNTNLSGEAFLRRYTQRVWSRITDLCVIWNMKGEDKRRVDVV